MRWFWRRSPPTTCIVRSACSTLTGFAISGPECARADAAPRGAGHVERRLSSFFAVQGDGGRLCRRRSCSAAGFTGELGYEIWVTPDYQAQLYDEILAAGDELGLAHYGGRAISSLRLEKNYGSFNKDFRPDYTAGRDRARRLRRFRQGRLRRQGRGSSPRSERGPESASPPGGRGAACRRRRLRGDPQGRRGRRPRHLGRLRPHGRQEHRRSAMCGPSSRGRRAPSRSTSSARNARPCCARRRCTTPTAAG